MNANDEDLMQVEDKAQSDSEVEIVRWDGDPEPNSVVIKLEADDTVDPIIQKENNASKLATLCDPNYLAKAHEAATKRAVILKRNELKWKLMQASQIRNKAKLGEIKTELSYYREKLSKTQDLAARLRAKYLKVIKSAKLTEAHMNKAENHFQSQERFVADEKMELTKIAFDCINVGKSLYGDDYKLPANPQINNSSFNTRPGGKEAPKSTKKPLLNQTEGKRAATSNQNIVEPTKAEILDGLAPFLRRARAHANSSNMMDNEQNKPTVSSITSRNESHPSSNSSSDKLNYSLTAGDLRTTLSKRQKRAKIDRLSSDSILENLVTYRLTSKFGTARQTKQEQSLKDLTYAHNQYPYDYVCLPDLINQCTDKTCAYKHKSSYMKSDHEKLDEILASNPQTTFNFLLSLQMDHKRPLPTSLTTALAGLAPSVVHESTTEH